MTQIVTAVMIHFCLLGSQETTYQKVTETERLKKSSIDVYFIIMQQHPLMFLHWLSVPTKNGTKQLATCTITLPTTTDGLLSFYLYWRHFKRSVNTLK